jgi:hypothetical protein
MRLKRALAATAAAATMVTLTANPAEARLNDNFKASTTQGGCGVLNFKDYGRGAPGNGNNDDYLVIHDYCRDGHGVRAWAFVKTRGTSNYRSLGSKYNGNGRAGAPVYWDPFKAIGTGNLHGGDVVAIRVCLVDSKSDRTPFKCSIYKGKKQPTYHLMRDG